MSAEIPPFAIGSRLWPGAAKVSEEAGELIQVIGKLVAYPDNQHPDGSDLRERLIEEVGDVLAALDYFVFASGLPWSAINAREDEKHKRFWRWHEQELAAASRGGTGDG